MIRATTFAGKTVAVFGLGGSGNAMARALIEGGAIVAAWDDNASGREAAAKLGIPIVDLAKSDWSAYSALMLAPGVPLTHPAPHWVVLKAHQENEARLNAAQDDDAEPTVRPGRIYAKRSLVAIIGDVEVFFRERAAHCPDAPVIAITGTNGKSTTTSLVTHVLRTLGVAAEMGGNIGRAVLTLEPPAPDKVHVLELSSFQIDLTPTLNPTIAVVLNITADHIDRHGSIEHYAAVKERLAASADAACIGTDDGFTRVMAERQILRGRPLYGFTTGKGAAVIPRLYAIGSTLFVHETGGAYASSTEIATLDGIGTLRGRHNVQNALAALAALRALQDRLDELGSPLRVWKPDAMKAALASYPGLPHRMEEVGRLARSRGGQELRPVLFVNDSKATNADSTEKALSSWERGIFWIAGGKPKDGGITALAPYFPRIAKAYLIGEAAEEFAATLNGKVTVERCGTLEQAVEAAARDAMASEEREPVVLLSPACASYDQFKNFEVRGDRFRALARGLAGVHADAPAGV